MQLNNPFISLGYQLTIKQMTMKKSALQFIGLLLAPFFIVYLFSLLTLHPEWIKPAFETAGFWALSIFYWIFAVCMFGAIKSDN